MRGAAMFEDSAGFEFECVTSTVSVYENEGIRVDVLNASDADQRIRVTRLPRYGRRGP